MARTTGPLLSLGASGSVAGTMTYASWKGRSYVRQTVTPANPKTPAQTAQRAMMRFLSQTWAPFVAAQASNWQELATQEAVSPFNAFTKYNLMRWTQNQYPYVIPNGSAGPAFDVLDAMVYTGGARQIQISSTLTTKNSGWGIMYFVNAAANPANTKTNAKIAIDTSQIGSTNPITGVITGLAPGSYHVGYIQFDEGGNADTPVEDATPVTVT